MYDFFSRTQCLSNIFVSTEFRKTQNLERSKKIAHRSRSNSPIWFTQINFLQHISGVLISDILEMRICWTQTFFTSFFLHYRSETGERITNAHAHPTNLPKVISILRREEENTCMTGATSAFSVLS